MGLFRVFFIFFQFYISAWQKGCKKSPESPESHGLAVVFTSPSEQMKSPLRYPGGKTRAIPILSKAIKHFKGKTILSPFMGGGSFELFLADTYQIKANDLFKPLYIFWKVVKERPQELAAAVEVHMPIYKELFKELQDTILDMTDELEIATAYYIVNRSSFSGATFCGGFSYTPRLNEASLNRLANMDLRNITFTNMDCLAFLDAHPPHPDALVYADPPYYIESYLYGSGTSTFNHEAFAKKIQERSDWILCYNDCPQVRALYKGCRIEKVAWAYGMTTKKSSEVLIFK